MYNIVYRDHLTVLPGHRLKKGDLILEQAKDWPVANEILKAYRYLEAYNVMAFVRKLDQALVRL